MKLRLIHPGLFFCTLCLMGVGVIVLSSISSIEEGFWTPHVKGQLKWYTIGFVVHQMALRFDYRKLIDLSIWMYILGALLLLGLFFSSSAHQVHRWYRFGWLPFDIQPSEYMKYILLFLLCSHLVKLGKKRVELKEILKMGVLFLLPFALILKQPDLGTALLLCPPVAVLFYLGGVSHFLIRMIYTLSCALLLFVVAIFSGIIPHESLRPIALKFLKEYQYERLNPKNHYHQKAAIVAIAKGGAVGTGWKKSEFTAGKWLPYAHTDSVFPAFGEQFGLVGLYILIGLFYGFVYSGFQIARMAREEFGQLLAASITTLISSHILLNIAMMCGLLPVTGIPFLLVTYGGSSVLCVMGGLGILQSIYSRRFSFP